MDLGIAGKRAVVIGGSSGLGYAVSERLAAEGVNLVIFARDTEKLRLCKEKLQSAHGAVVEICSGDITKEADVDRLAHQCKQIGGVEILVLNTPRPPSPMRDFLEETEQARWDLAYEQQLHGALLLLRKITPLLPRYRLGAHRRHYFRHGETTAASTRTLHGISRGCSSRVEAHCHGACRPRGDCELGCSRNHHHAHIRHLPQPRTAGSSRTRQACRQA